MFNVNKTITTHQLQSIKEGIIAQKIGSLEARIALWDIVLSEIAEFAVDAEVGNYCVVEAVVRELPNGDVRHYNSTEFGFIIDGERSLCVYHNPDEALSWGLALINDNL